MAGTGIGDRLREALQGAEKEIIKIRLKRKIEPYLEALESEAGFCQEDFNYLIRHNISFFDRILPHPWRQDLLDIVSEHRQFLDLNDLSEDDVRQWARLFAEAMVELRPWMILPWPYLKAELDRFKAALVDRSSSE